MRYVLILGLIALALSGLVYYLLFHDSMPEMPQESSQAAPAADAADAESDNEEFTGAAGTGSLQELRTLGETVECSITYEPQDGSDSVEGTYFVNDRNVRGDFLTETPDLSGQMLSSLILRDDTMYVWSTIDGETYGLQMDLSQLDATEAEGNQPIPLDDSVEYDCAPWTNVDRTIFEPPQDVLFQDFSELMQAGMEYGTLYEEGQMMTP